MILAWAVIHQDELMQNWELAKKSRGTQPDRAADVGGTSMQMTYSPEVVQVVPFPDHTVSVYFSDGKIVSYDVKPLLTRVFSGRSRTWTFL